MRQFTTFLLVLMAGSTIAFSADGSAKAIQGQAQETKKAARADAIRLRDHSPLDWSQGILALVSTEAPDTPVYSWNAGAVDCGSDTVWATFYMRNVGPEVVTTGVPVVRTDGVFANNTNCTCFGSLNPGQTSSCTITLAFVPSSDGVFRDTLRIETDADNSFGGYARFPLEGFRGTAPASPQVIVEILGNNAELHWLPVTHSLSGCPIAPPVYRVFSAPGSDGPYQFFGSTEDTSYVLQNIVSLLPQLFVRVTAESQ